MAAALMALSIVPSFTGCYAYRPVAIGGVANRAANGAEAGVEAGVAPGATVALALTDRGRVALGEVLGPGVARFHGTMGERRGSVLVIRVSTVEFLDGRRERWSGEPVPVPVDAVAVLSERQPSRSRSILLAGGALVALAVVATQTSIFGGGTTGETPKPEPPPGSQ